MAPLENQYIGTALEGFVVGELLKQRTWSDVEFELFHHRDRNGREVDVVAEFHDGSAIGIEVKSTSTPKQDHFSGLISMRDRLGDRFLGGYLLNTSKQSAVFGDRLWTLPAAALWGL